MIEWLGDAFGFEPMAVYDAPDGSLAHAELRLERGAIMLGQSREDDLGTLSPRAAGGVTQTIYAWVADVDALGGRQTLGDPEQPIKAHRMVDAQRPGVAEHRVDRLAVGLKVACGKAGR